MSPDEAEAQAALLVEPLAAAAADSDHEGGFPGREFDWLRAAGLLAAPVARSAGGADLGAPPHTLALLRTLQHLGRGNLAVGRLYEGHVNALQLVASYGTPLQQERWAADARQGHLFAVWNTEDRDGVRLEPLGGGRWRLGGGKTFASGAGHASRPLVTGARPDGGWQMVVLPADRATPGIDRAAWRPLGMRATASFRVDLGGIEVSDDDLLGPPGAYYGQPAFGGGAIRFVAVQLGGVEAVCDETRRFLRSLGRLDDPHQQVRVGEMIALLASGLNWLPPAAAQAALAAPGLVTFAAMMRAAVEPIALRVMVLAERCVGARGLLQPGPLERLHRDLTHYLRQAAPDATLPAVGCEELEREGRSGGLGRA